MGILTVKLLKVTNLKDEDTLGKSDPYVKFYLEQDNMMFDKNYGKKESTKKKNDLNPEYNETFEFEDLPSLNNMVLHIKVMDDDIGFDSKLGSGEIKLEKMNLTESAQATEVVVDKKRPGLSLSPVTLFCSCCKSMFSKSATIYLELSYKD